MSGKDFARSVVCSVHTNQIEEYLAKVDALPEELAKAQVISATLALKSCLDVVAWLMTEVQTPILSGSLLLPEQLPLHTNQTEEYLAQVDALLEELAKAQVMSATLGTQIMPEGCCLYEHQCRLQRSKSGLHSSALIFVQRL